MFGKIVIALGVLGIVLGIAIAAVSALLPEFTSGRVSWEEAALGIIPGVVILFISLLILAAGVVILVIGRKKT